jgi:hypothetical protein
VVPVEVGTGQNGDVGEADQVRQVLVADVAAADDRDPDGANVVAHNGFPSDACRRARLLICCEGVGTEEYSSDLLIDLGRASDAKREESTQANRASNRDISELPSARSSLWNLKNAVPGSKSRRCCAEEAPKMPVDFHQFM